MTRPKKDEQTVRSNSIHIRMNDTEYELLQERASAVNMSMAEFMGTTKVATSMSTS